jgi:hypothetical protein
MRLPYNHHSSSLKRPNMDSDSIDTDSYHSEQPDWRLRKDRIPSTHHSKDKKSGRGSAKNQLHKLFKREYLIKADIKRSADKFGKWYDEREKEDGKEREDEGEGGQEEETVASTRGGISEGDVTEEDVTVWDEELMKMLEEEDRAAWAAILRERRQTCVSEE